MNKFATYHKPCFYNQLLCNYLNLDHEKPYFRSYVFKILTSKLTNEGRHSPKFGTYELSEELVNILRSHNNFWYSYVSPTRLLSYLNKLKIPSSHISSNIYTLKINEDSCNFESIEI